MCTPLYQYSSQQYPPLQISNMLANTKVPFKVNLTKLATEHKRECTYEQEISSSADFKFTDLHVTIRVFHTGAIVMLGGRRLT